MPMNNHTSNTAIQALYTAETEQVGWQYHVITEESAGKNHQ